VEGFHDVPWAVRGDQAVAPQWEWSPEPVERVPPARNRAPETWQAVVACASSIGMPQRHIFVNDFRAPEQAAQQNPGPFRQALQTTTALATPLLRPVLHQPLIEALQLDRSGAALRCPPRNRAD